MVELADRAVEAAWKIQNLPDYDGRLERVARRFEERMGERSEPPLVVYETALMKSGRGGRRSVPSCASSTTPSTTRRSP
jgi:hypothetical protein